MKAMYKHKDVVYDALYKKLSTEIDSSTLKNIGEADPYEVTEW